MDVWSGFVGLFYSALMALSTLYGGNLGAAVLTLGVIVRLAFLPLTLRLARQALWRQSVLAKLKPELLRLNKRFKNDPGRLLEETRALHERHGVSPFDGASLRGAVVQAPFFIGLYSAIGRAVAAGGRFFWIADLAKPDVLLASIVAVITWLAVAISPGAQDHKALVSLLPALVLFVVVSRVAAGLALHFAGSSAVSLLQSGLVKKLGPLAPNAATSA